MGVISWDKLMNKPLQGCALYCIINLWILIQEKTLSQFKEDFRTKYITVT